jgi:hypothetical protein
VTAIDRCDVIHHGLTFFQPTAPVVHAPSMPGASASLT